MPRLVGSNTLPPPVEYSRANSDFLVSNLLADDGLPRVCREVIEETSVTVATIHPTYPASYTQIQWHHDVAHLGPCSRRAGTRNGATVRARGASTLDAAEA